MPICCGDATIGTIDALQYGGGEGSLYAYGSLLDKTDIDTLKINIAVMEFAFEGVVCGMCGAMSRKRNAAECDCLHRSPCLILRSICIERVLFYPQWHEDSKEAGSRSAYLENFFSDAIAHMQIVDPL